MSGLRTFTLPQPELCPDTLSRHFCTLFLHEFQKLPARDVVEKIGPAIIAASARSGLPPDAVALSLVEGGLRAPKECFPENFVETLERKRRQPRWNLAAATTGQHALMDFWGLPVPQTGHPAQKLHIQ